MNVSHPADWNWLYCHFFRFDATSEIWKCNIFLESKGTIKWMFVKEKVISCATVQLFISKFCSPSPKKTSMKGDCIWLAGTHEWYFGPPLWPGVCCVNMANSNISTGLNENIGQPWIGWRSTRNNEVVVFWRGEKFAKTSRVPPDRGSV